LVPGNITASPSSDFSSPLIRNDEDLGDLGSHDLPQNRFLDLLGNLWDSTLDLASCKDSGVALNHATKAMVKFLVEVSAADSAYSMSIEYPDDLVLVQRISKIFSPIHPDLAMELLMSVRQFPSWPSSSARLSYKEDLSHGKISSILSKDLCEEGLGSLVNCVSQQSLAAGLWY
jgi:hypothetical protein